MGVNSGRTAATIEDARERKKERGSYTQSQRNASPFV